MTDRLPVMVLLIVCTVAVMPLCAQSDYAPIEPLPLGTVLLTLPSPHVPADGSWEIRFNHRFGAAGDDAGATLLGLDSGANVGFSVAWVPMRDLEVGLTRTNVLDTIELAARYVVVQQAAAIPMSLTLRGGVDWRAERSVEDPTSLFLQAVAARRLSSRTELFLLPTWVTNAGRTAVEGGSAATFDSAFNVPVGIAFLLRRDLSVIAELIPPNGDLRDSADPGWALGAKKAIGGHHFEVVVTNSPATTVDQYVSSSHQGVPLSGSDVHLGFNISRRFGR